VSVAGDQPYHNPNEYGGGSSDATVVRANAALDPLDAMPNATPRATPIATPHGDALQGGTQSGPETQPQTHAGTEVFHEIPRAERGRISSIEQP
jgi:hypothetical protein